MKRVQTGHAVLDPETGSYVLKSARELRLIATEERAQRDVLAGTKTVDAAIATLEQAVIRLAPPERRVEFIRFCEADRRPAYEALALARQQGREPSRQSLTSGAR